jgi:23S rRNA (pseudouridine1915-N3)-methyltransferase
MRIHLIAVGQKMPAWVNQGYQEFARRLPADCSLHLSEIAALRRGKNADLNRIAEQEAESLLAAVPKAAMIVALDERGQPWSTRQLAEKFDDWRQNGSDVALLVGGPDGLAEVCRQRARHIWSLSPLTLPHALVRVLVAEQLYRAWSIGVNHPYHRD